MLPEKDIIQLAIDEDVGPGDITTKYFTPESLRARAAVVARQACVLAGLDPACEVFRRIDGALEIQGLAEDGVALAAGQAFLEIRGRAASILTAERTALNFLQRLSGIATLTRRYAEAVRGTSAAILDTRKTTPGWRALEKAAVRAGGGRNHRLGLYDMVMVKDNHLAAASPDALQEAIRRARVEGVRVELEADTLDQVRLFLTLDGVDVILLDNMPASRLREAVALRRPGVAFEASGGITLENVREVAETGVDFISVGALTHSAAAADLSLELTHEG